jgi:hypothetical protein
LPFGASHNNLFFFNSTTVSRIDRGYCAVYWNGEESSALDILSPACLIREPHYPDHNAAGHLFYLIM